MILAYLMFMAILAAICAFYEQWDIVVLAAFVGVGFIGQSIVDAITGKIK